MNLSRRIGIAALATVLTTLLVYVVLSFWPKTYHSQEVLHFPLAHQPAGAATPFAGLGGEGDALAILSLSGALMSPLVASSPSTATGILESRTCMSTVVTELDLAKKWDTSHDKAIKQLRGHVSVTTDENGFLVITAQGGSPERCVAILEVMDRHLRRRADELTLNVSKSNRKEVEARYENAVEEIEEHEDAYVAAQREFPITEVSALQSAYLQTDQGLREARIAYESANANIQRFESLVDGLLANADSEDDQLRILQVVEGGASDTNTAIGELAVELQERRLALDDVAKDFTEQSAEFRQALQQAETARSFADETVEQVEESLDEGRFPSLVRAKSELAALGERVSMYEAVLAEYERMVRESPAERAQVERARGTFEAALGRAANLRQELELARIAETRDPSRFEVVDPPMKNSVPIAPRKALLSGLWLLGFGALATWWAVRNHLTFVE